MRSIGHESGTTCKSGTCMHSLPDHSMSYSLCTDSQCTYTTWTDTHTQHMTRVVPSIIHKPHTHTHLPLSTAHIHCHLHSAQVKLRLGLLVFQPLLDVHQWTSIVIHLVHHIGLGLSETHNLTHKHNLRRVGGGGW